MRKDAATRMDCQSLCDDYWEGFYLADRHIVLCTDSDGSSVSYRGFSLKDGSEEFSGAVPYSEGDLFSEVSGSVFSAHGVRLHMMVSSEVENPDRHAEILRVLASGEVFDMVRIRDLADRLSRPSMRMFVGKVGGAPLYDGGFAGFYLLSDGSVLSCRDAVDWDPSQTGSISDGAVAYRIIPQSRFSLDKCQEHTEGYLVGDTFADFCTRLPGDRRLVRVLGLEGSEGYGLLERALQGDGKAAELANHRLRLDLRL